jgi:Ion channel
MTWLLRRKFQALLLAQVVLLVGYPILRGVYGGRVLFDALVTAVFLTAFLVVFTERGARILSLSLGIPTLVGLWVGYALPGLPVKPLVAGFHVVAALFLVLTVATVLRAINRDATVSTDSVYGAFCGYLLLGVAFGHLYCVIEELAPGSFRGDVDFSARLADYAGQRFVLTYFSFLTLTTVGYGDIVPATDTSRGAAVAEAIAGQFYIAVLVAQLIGKRVAVALSARVSDADGPPGGPQPR